MQYLVPRSVKARVQLLPGVGWTELGMIVGGAVLGYILGLLVALPFHNYWGLLARVFVFPFPPGFAYLISQQGFSGESPLQILRARRRWLQKPRLYLYRHSKGGHTG